MEKTISNIKKILHIGPKKVKDDNFKNDANDAPKMQEKVMTTKIELSREFLLTEAGLQCKTCVKTTMSDDIQAESVTENCAACELPIHVKNLVFDGERNWHYKCFSCGQCNTALVNQKYYDKAGNLFCNNCFLAEYLPTCFNCREEIKGKSGVKMSAVSGQMLTWHQACLHCSVCSEGVTLDNVVFRDNLFCKPCYLDTMLNKCEQCRKVGNNDITSTLL